MHIYDVSMDFVSVLALTATDFLVIRQILPLTLPCLRKHSFKRKKYTSFTRLRLRCLIG